MGASLAVTAPTGLYSPDKVLNLGADGWSSSLRSVFPPIGPERKWAFDAYANSYFYTANTSYRGVEVKATAITCLQRTHQLLIPRQPFGSLDARYSFRGDTSVDNLDQDDSQRNFILGSEVIVSLNARNSFGVTLAKALVHRYGPAVTGISVRYDYVWGKGYR